MATPRFPTITAISSVTAALTAAFFACAAPRASDARYHALLNRGAVVGSIESRLLGQRKDASGPFTLSSYDFKLFRWVDGAGVRRTVAHALTARRPGGPVYFATGESDAGSFRYRARARGYELVVTDEFGNVTRRRGAPPALFTFLGAPLPFAANAAASDVIALDLASAEEERFSGKGTAGKWEGYNAAGFLRITYEDEEVVAVEGTCPLSLRRQTKAVRPTSFVFEQPRITFLSYPFPNPGPNDIYTLPLYVRLDKPITPENLSGPGQSFTGTITRDCAEGVFAVTPKSQPSFVGTAGFAATGWDTWPLLSGGDGAARTAAVLRGQGKKPVFVSGVGVFGGNVLSPYTWLEADGRAYAPPGQPLPAVRIALDRGESPAAVRRVALTAPPERNHRELRAFGESVPGLRSADELEYRVYKDAVLVGFVNAAYDAPVDGTPSFFAAGLINGVAWDDAAPAAFADGASVRAFDDKAVFAESLCLGCVVGANAPREWPVYTFSLPGDKPGFLWRVRWKGFSETLVGGVPESCRVYAIEPGGVTAFYTADGVLTRLKWADYEARLVSFPKKPTASAVTLAAEGSTGPTPPTSEEPPTP